MRPGTGPAAPISITLCIEIVPWIQPPCHHLLTYHMEEVLTNSPPPPSLFLRLVSETVLKALL